MNQDFSEFDDVLKKPNHIEQTEAVAEKCSAKKVFLENTCSRVFFLNKVAGLPFLTEHLRWLLLNNRRAVLLAVQLD